MNVLDLQSDSSYSLVTSPPDYDENGGMESGRPRSSREIRDPEFREWRRDALRFREGVDERFRDLENRLRKSNQWAIGIISGIVLLVGGALLGSYIGLLQREAELDKRIEHIAVRQDTIVDAGNEQNKINESLNERLRILEQHGWKASQ